MTDTQRSRVTLQSLFADNSTGEISPQDLRDFVASVKLYAENQFIPTGGTSPFIPNCASGNHFDVAATTDLVVGVPTNVSSRLSDKMIIRVRATTGIVSVSLTGVSGGFRFGQDITALSSVADGKTDYIGLVYNSGSSYWDVVGYVRGY